MAEAPALLDGWAAPSCGWGSDLPFEREVCLGALGCGPGSSLRSGSAATRQQPAQECLSSSSLCARCSSCLAGISTSLTALLSGVRSKNTCTGTIVFVCLSTGRGPSITYQLCAESKR